MKSYKKDLNDQFKNKIAELKELTLDQEKFNSLISKFISSGYPSNASGIEDCLKFASVCGLLTCLGEGAIEQQPDYEKVNKFLGSLIK